MSLPELVIFDCDGVLVDSERITNQVFVQKLNGLGLELTLKDMFEQFVGHTMEYDLALAERLLQKPLPHNFEADLRAAMTEALTEKLQPVEGIHEVLDWLSQQPIQTCVASSGDHDKMRTTLGITQLRSYFEGRIFSVTEVERPKPAPDIFLYAAAQMGVAPSKCLVIEDSPTGVKAAVAAEMKVLGYAKLMPAERLETAGAIAFTEMRQLAAWIENL